MPKLRPIFIRRVVGRSMEPALPEGKIVVAICSQRLRPGQVVVIMHDGLEKIKRIDRLEIDRLFVVGDNLVASTDSRTFGWITRRAVIGRVVWPWHL